MFIYYYVKLRSPRREIQWKADAPKRPKKIYREQHLSEEFLGSAATFQ